MVGMVVDGTFAEYRNGEGLGGERPEFHDFTSLGVMRAPTFCPFCVFDQSLDWDLCMKQLVTFSSFKIMLALHIDNAASDMAALAPVIELHRT
jgi:hypothetical protein